VSFLNEAIDRAFERADVEAMGAVFAEGGRAWDREAEPAVAAGLLQMGGEASQLALAEVGVDVALIYRERRAGSRTT
jgi:hypothetical protein